MRRDSMRLRAVAVASHRPNHRASRWARSCSSLSRLACTRASGSFGDEALVGELALRPSDLRVEALALLGALGLELGAVDSGQQFDLDAAGRDRRDRVPVAVDGVQMRQRCDERRQPVETR